MRNIIINTEQNSITSFWSDGSITWLPLDTYKFKEDEDYSILVQSDAAGYNKPRIIKGSYLIALLKRILESRKN